MRICRDCNEYKGIIICRKCKREFCNFCEGNGDNVCPDCEED